MLDMDQKQDPENGTHCGYDSEKAKSCDSRGCKVKDNYNQCFGSEFNESGSGILMTKKWGGKFAAGNFFLIFFYQKMKFTYP
jgi:hypothetical protein